MPPEEAPDPRQPQPVQPPPANDFGRIALVVVAVGFLFATVGELLFENVFPVDAAYRGNERASLFVCGCSFAAFITACVNAYRASTGGTTLAIALPTDLDTWVGTGVAITIGVAIGTTVFR